MDAATWAALLCSAIVSTQAVSKPTSESMAVCMEVAAKADDAGLPIEVAVALAFTESRFNASAVSNAGAKGPLQVLPRFYCPGRTERGCDLVLAGIKGLQSNMRRYGKQPLDWHTVLCHWNSGHTCYRRSRLFARIVLARADAFRHEAMITARE